MVKMDPERQSHQEEKGSLLPACSFAVGECQAFQNRGFVAKSWPGFAAESWEGEEHHFKCYMCSENGIFKVSQAAEAQTFGSLD